jgi:hypothetical protein
MTIKELKENMLIARHIKDIKQAKYKIAEGEYIVLENKYNLYLAEIELKRKMEEIQRDELNGSN